MQTEPELVLKSIRVVPKNLLDSGFAFNYSTTVAAIDNLIEKQRVN
jgi:NAD dependent epimerase/dehydratase family enzyme